MCFFSTELGSLNFQQEESTLRGQVEAVEIAGYGYGWMSLGWVFVFFGKCPAGVHCFFYFKKLRIRIHLSKLGATISY